MTIANPTIETANHQKCIRIGCAAAFWGDTTYAIQQFLTEPNLDYLIFDYLAEVTMSIMAGQQLKNPKLGYATDFVKQVIAPLLSTHKQLPFKVITNAGGLNPSACKEALEAIASKHDIKLNIAIVHGDNLMPQIAELKQQPITPLDHDIPFPNSIVTCNAYLGAPGIVAALQQGADIVLTGRVVDSALVLAPLIHEFNWSVTKDFDRLAQGALAGHIIECGTQCTGGNFTDWHQIEDFTQMGFPIVECLPNGEFFVTKTNNTNGMVTTATVAEQLVYEIDNPAQYQLPDVICNFSQVKLTQQQPNQVKVIGAIGYHPSQNYKVCATYTDGFKVTATFLLAGIDAIAKAKRVSESILSRVNTLLNQQGLTSLQRTSIELLGSEACFGNQGNHHDTREVVIKIAATHQTKEALVLLAREIAPAATAMTPGLTGIVGGRPSVHPMIRLYSFLLPKQAVQVQMTYQNQCHDIHIYHEGPASLDISNPAFPVIDQANLTSEIKTVPLIELAWARSGDKGDHTNIGVIARNPKYYPYITAALTNNAVATYMSHVLDPNKGSVERWPLPGIHAINFLLKHSLDGGGIASLRIDPQGKTYAQQLLSFPIPIPKDLK